MMMFAPTLTPTGAAAITRYGATHPLISMLLHPDSVDLQRKIRLQLLQRRISSRLSERERAELQWTVAAAVDGDDEDRAGLQDDEGDGDGDDDDDDDDDDEPFNAKMQ